jgi:hypothetical protein
VKCGLYIYYLHGTETEYSNYVRMRDLLLPSLYWAMQRLNELTGVRMDMKLLGEEGKGRRGVPRLNKFKYSILCIILEFIEYFPHLFMLVNIISWQKHGH